MQINSSESQSYPQPQQNVIPNHSSHHPFEKVSIHLIEDLLNEQKLTFEIQNANNHLLEQIHDLQYQTICLKNYLKTEIKTDIAQYQNNITLKTALNDKKNQTQEIDLQIVKLQMEETNLYVDISRANTRIQKTNKQMQRLYQRIEEVENQLNQLKTTVNDLEVQNQVVDTELNRVKQIIDNSLFRETIWQGRSAMDIIRQKGSYNEIVGFFAREIDIIRHRVEDLKRERPGRRQIKEEIEAIKHQHRLLEQENFKKKEQIARDNELYQQLLTRQFILQNDFSTIFNQKVNKRVSDQKNILNLKLERQRRIINSLTELIRLKGPQLYNEALNLIQKNK